METENNCTLYIQSMEQSFEIRFMTNDIDEANKFMENNPETSCIDETKNGIIIIV